MRLDICVISCGTRLGRGGGDYATLHYTPPKNRGADKRNQIHAGRDVYDDEGEKKDVKHNGSDKINKGNDDNNDNDNDNDVQTELASMTCSHRSVVSLLKCRLARLKMHRPTAERLNVSTATCSIQQQVTRHQDMAKK